MNSLKQHEDYLKGVKREKQKVLVAKVVIFISFVGVWQLLASLNLIDTFFISSPQRVIKCIINLYAENNLFKNLFTTILEVLVSFPLATAIGLLISVLLWRFNSVYKVLEPYFVVLNSLPKVCLTPLIVFWFGCGVTTILIISVLLAITVTILNLVSAFNSVDKEKVKLLNTFGASRWQILKTLIIPASVPSILSILKVNIGLCWIGVIIGEFQVGRGGLGYLITYGAMVCKIDMVVTAIVILTLISYVFYSLVTYFQRKLRGRYI